MANENQNSNAQQPRKPVHLSYDIKNPTRARRVIYDGIPETMKCITVEPNGGEKKRVTLHADIVKELKQRNKDKPDSDLIVTLCSPDVVKKEDEAAA